MPPHQVNATARNTALPSPSYVTHLAKVASGYAALASAPADAIHLFDASTLSLLTTRLEPHGEHGTSALRAPIVRGLPTLASCGKDGAFRLWDDRVQTPSLTIRAPHSRVILSFDVESSGTYAAVGTDSPSSSSDALIHVFDLRAPAAPLQTHSETHSDEVTVLHFSSTPEGLRLLSASGDGLLCVSDPSLDEDDAVLLVANWGTSIARAGWLPGGTGLWAGSDMETFALWDVEMDLTAETNIKEAELAGVPWKADYTIDAWQSSTSSCVVGFGNNSGDFTLTTVTADNNSLRIRPHAVCSRGHQDIVRSMFWDVRQSVLVTGGEDARINTWRIPTDDWLPAEAVLMDDEDDEMDVDDDTGKRQYRNQSMRVSTPGTSSDTKKVRR